MKLLVAGMVLASGCRGHAEATFGVVGEGTGDSDIDADTVLEEWPADPLWSWGEVTTVEEADAVFTLAETAIGCRVVWYRSERSEQPASSSASRIACVAGEAERPGLLPSRGRRSGRGGPR